MKISKTILKSPLDNTNLTLEESNQLLNVHTDILEVMITGSDFQLALDSLCVAAEGILPEALASIILFNKDGATLYVRSAPNIPQQAIDQLSGLVPGGSSGSCAATVYRGTPQYVYDTQIDPMWANVRDFARTYNINACWSMPIVEKSGRVIGSFALSSFENRLPSYFQESLLKTAAYLAGLVLLREKEENLLKIAAHCDPLTGLPNRLMFNMRVEQAIARADRNESKLAVFFIDLDDFKKINDELGHEMGDSVLSIIDIYRFFKRIKYLLCDHLQLFNLFKLFHK